VVKSGLPRLEDRAQRVTIESRSDSSWVLSVNITALSVTRVVTNGVAYLSTGYIETQNPESLRPFKSYSAYFVKRLFKLRANCP
jgi:hypothetical protein